VASPFLHARFEPKLYERVLRAADAEHVSLSAFLRMAVEEKLGTVERLEAERAALLAEGRAFLANPGTTDVDLQVASLVERYVKAIESNAGRLSLAEQRGRARALQEIAAGALEPLDGAELTFPEFHPDAPLVGLETTAPRRRGYLREQLARERARGLLQVPAPMPPPPSATAMLGEGAARELFRQAIGWGNVKSVYCGTHGIVPNSPERPDRCYLGCRIDASDNGPEAT
jgi:hypothetical protein